MSLANWTQTSQPRQHMSSELRDADVLVPPPEMAPIGIVRTKAMAVLLGPAGFGLMGPYGSIADVVVSIAGMGVGSSGVRQIAEAASSGDDKRIARTVTVLRRMAVLLGILGAGLLVVFCRQVSALTFGTDEHAGAVALLSLVVLFRLVAAGQGGFNGVIDPHRSA